MDKAKTCIALVFNMISQMARHKIQISEHVCSEMFTNKKNLYVDYFCEVKSTNYIARLKI